MALHKLTITVIDGGKSTSQSLQDGKTNQSGLSKALNYNQTIKQGMSKELSPATMFATGALVNIAMQTGRQTLNYYITDIGRANGDSNYQAIVNRTLEIGTDILGIAGSTLAGAAAGSVIPGIGTAVGAVVGATAAAASSGISLAFRQANRERTYQHTLFTEGNAQGYNLARANYKIYTGRVR